MPEQADTQDVVPETANRAPIDRAGPGHTQDLVPEESARVLVNRAELATAFCVSLPTIQRWLDQGCPFVQAGGLGREWQFDLAAVKAWRDQRLDDLEAQSETRRQAIMELQASLDLSPTDSAVTGLTPRQREEYYRAEQRRMDIDRARGFLVETAKLRQEFDRVSGFLADRLQSLPDLLERRCHLEGAAVEAVATEIDAWQEQLAKDLQAENLGPEIGSNQP